MSETRLVMNFLNSGYAAMMNTANNCGSWSGEYLTDKKTIPFGGSAYYDS
jgi:hypothetical protein